MQCLRCKNEMEQYPFNSNLGIYGEEYKAHPGSSVCQQSHNPRSVYVCDHCGYMEFSVNQCEESNI